MNVGLVLDIVAVMWAWILLSLVVRFVLIPCVMLNTYCEVGLKSKEMIGRIDSKLTVFGKIVLSVILLPTYIVVPVVTGVCNVLVKVLLFMFVKKQDVVVLSADQEGDEV